MSSFVNFFYKNVRHFCKLSSKVAAPFWHPTSSEWELLLPHISSAFCAVSIPDCGHSNRCDGVSCCLGLHFPDDIWYGTSFHMHFCHSYIFFGEVSSKIFGPFRNCIIFNKVFVNKHLFIQCVFCKHFLTFLILLMLSFTQQSFSF